MKRLILWRSLWVYLHDQIFLSLVSTLLKVVDEWMFISALKNYQLPKRAKLCQVSPSAPG